MLREIKPEETLEEVDLSWSPFWIRVYDVSIGFKSQKIVTIIGGASREFVEWDSREESGNGMPTQIRTAITFDSDVR